MDQGEMEEDILAECLHYTQRDMITPSLVQSGKTFFGDHDLDLDPMIDQ